MRKLSAADKENLAREVLQLRYWQHLVNEALKEGTFIVPVHVAIGHEAIAVAVNNVMTAGDQLVLSHRNIEYNLARSGSLAPVVQEYLLSPDGAAKGNLGSMNLTQPDRGTVYTSSILGNNMPVACGLALGKTVTGSSGIVIVLTGDGAMEEGTFYESLVFSKSHGLPLLVIVENNDQAMSSTIEQRRCPVSIADMCAAVDIPFYEFRGNDVWQYWELLAECRDTVAGNSPVCVEVHLKAITNHAGATPGWPTDPKVMSLDDGLVVEQSWYDPVFVLEQALSPQSIATMTQDVVDPGREKIAEWADI